MSAERLQPVAYHAGKHRGQDQAAEEYEDEPAPPYAPPPPAPAVADSSPAEELKRLAELHEQGCLTDDELRRKRGLGRAFPARIVT